MMGFKPRLFQPIDAGMLGATLPDETPVHGLIYARIATISGLSP